MIKFHQSASNTARLSDLWTKSPYFYKKFYENWRAQNFAGFKKKFEKKENQLSFRNPARGAGAPKNLTDF
jgi:hypothetical protein